MTSSFRKGIEDILATADRYGFTRHKPDGSLDKEALDVRHGMMENYREAQAEFKRLVAPPIETAYNQREVQLYIDAMVDHCKTKAISYLNKRIDRIHMEESKYDS